MLRTMRPVNARYGVFALFFWRIIKFCPAVGAKFFFAREEKDTGEFSAERASLCEKANENPRQQKQKSQLQQRMQPVTAAFPSALRQQDDADVQHHCADPVSNLLFLDLRFVLYCPSNTAASSSIIASSARSPQ